MGASKAWSFQNNQRSIHISNPLSLSLSLKNLNENQKSSKLELTFCWKLIGVSDERWSRGARTRSGARIWGFWRFGGFEDLGVLHTIASPTSHVWRLKLEVLRKFKFAEVFIQVAIHDLGFSFSEMSSRAQSQWSCYFFHAYFKGFYGCWNSSVKKIAYSEGHRQKRWVV